MTDKEQLTAKERAQRAALLALDKKAFNVKVLDIHRLSSIADYLVFADGHSDKQVQAIADSVKKGLKKYGMFVADNGQDWLMSISPDGRLQGLETLGRVKGSDFEVVDTGARSGNLQPGRRP